MADIMIAEWNGSFVKELGGWCLMCTIDVGSGSGHIKGVHVGCPEVCTSPRSLTCSSLATEVTTVLLLVFTRIVISYVSSVMYSLRLTSILGFTKPPLPRSLKPDGTMMIQAILPKARLTTYVTIIVRNLHLRKVYPETVVLEPEEGMKLDVNSRE
jgi:hypothetical protein